MTNTLGIIKPDGVSRGLIGRIIGKIESTGLILRGIKMLQLTEEQARQFYAIHKERPFYTSLVNYMTSGPIIVMAIGGDDTITRWRELMGATDPAKANPQSIRGEYGTSIENNVVHGSDGPDTARTEIAFFFDEKELLQKMF
jgi:nucleoside-diphosphate kinase